MSTLAAPLLRFAGKNPLGRLWPPARTFISIPSTSILMWVGNGKAYILMPSLSEGTAILCVACGLNALFLQSIGFPTTVFAIPRIKPREVESVNPGRIG